MKIARIISLMALILVSALSSTIVYGAKSHQVLPRPFSSQRYSPYPLHHQAQVHPPVSFDDGIKFSNPDGTKTLVIHGQIAVNHSRFNGAYNTDEFGEGRFGQDSKVQTARLSFGGQFTPYWTYLFQIANRGDSNDDLYFRQAMFTFTGWRFAKILIGKQGINYGVDDMHDVYNTYGTGFAMLSGAFTPNPSLGVALANYYARYKLTWNVGIYSFGNFIRNANSELQGEAGFAVNSAAYIARFGKTLYHDAYRGQTLFVQVSGFFLEGSGNQANPVQVNGNVLGTIGEDKIPPIGSGPIAIGALQKESNGVDVGMATQYGSLSIEAEYAHVRTMIGGVVDDHPRYEDAYIQGGWVVTGEHRQFNEKSGYLMGVIPKRKWGALELIARYEVIHLRSGIGEYRRKTGGNGRTITIGFDWYINSHVRIAFDATHLWRWGPRFKTKEGSGMVIQGNYFF